MFCTTVLSDHNDGIITGAIIPSQSEAGSNDNKEILYRSLGLQPYHQIQFSAIPRTSLMGRGCYLCKGYSQHILSPADRALHRKGILIQTYLPLFCVTEMVRTSGEKQSHILNNSIDS